MTIIDIFSGFLGAGKTTLIKKLIKEGYKNEKIVLVENEFGEIGIDGGFLKDCGVQINEMNSGCICCSLVGDFTKALSKVIEDYSPDRILIEPSGVGKLSDVIKATKSVCGENVKLGAFTTVADVSKVRLYMKNFGEFYNDQIENASVIFLSRTGGADEEKIAKAISMIREKNGDALIVTTPWDEISGENIVSVMNDKNSLLSDLENEVKAHHEHHHHHDEECDCHEHHHHDHDCDCHEHHHEHEHHHDHDGECSCGCHHHDHEHHHHADDVFESLGFETAKKFCDGCIREILEKFEDEKQYGFILRAKGIVPAKDGKWIHFDYVPGEIEIREGSADVTGRICVIGSKIDKEKIAKLFEE